MHKRVSKRRKDGAGYYEVDAGHGPVGLKVPLPIHCSIVAQEMATRGIADFSAVDQQSPRGRAMIASLYSLLGAVTGLSWYHRDYNLDTSRDLEDLFEYGEDVIRELMESGYTAAQLNTLMPEAHKRAMQSLVPESEVAAHEDFTEATPDPMPSG